jgi:hypothetical protein
MPEISYYLINQPFINKYKWIKQAEVVISVSGPTDPLSLQLMRDAVLPEVETRMTRLNAMLAKITERYDEIQRKHEERRKKSQPRDPRAVKETKDLLAQSQTIVKKAVEDFRPVVQEAVKQFCRENKADELKLKEFKESLTTNQTKTVINTAWSVFDVGKGVSEIFGGTAAAVTAGPVGVAAGVALFWKGCFDTAKGALELCGKLSEWWTGAQGAAERLQAQLEKLKNTSSSKEISKSDVTQVEKLLEDLESYILKAELTGKQLSRELQELLNESDKCPDEDDRKKFEKSIEGLIDQVEVQGPVIAKFRPFHKTAQKEIKDLGKAKLPDKVEVISTAKELYKDIGPLVDGVLNVATGDVVGVGKAALGWVIEKKTG